MCNNNSIIFLLLHTFIAIKIVESWSVSEYKQGTCALNRRETLFSGFATVACVWGGFIPPQVAAAYTSDPDKVQESLYFISRVQEATVQQERFVNRAKMQEDLKSKMKLTLRLIDKNYRLIDQISFCSGLVDPKEEVITASEAGYAAVDALQEAIQFVNSDLDKGTLTERQREFLTSSLKTTREELFVFLNYMPQDKLKNARLRVEDENVKNLDEFDGSDDAGVYNPVILPWKQK